MSGDRDAPICSEPTSQPWLRSELLRRRAASQAARDALIAGGASGLEHALEVDDDNTNWLRMIVAVFGWPGKSLVGDEGAHAAWLLAQHADRDMPFQRNCLALLTQAAADGEVSPRDAAHLTDRVLLADGKLQVYGTVLNARDGRYEAPRLCDPDRVDERRATMGLGTLAGHIAHTTEFYGPPTPAKCRCCKCKAEMEVWLPELGGSAAIRCGSCGFKTTARARIRPSVEIARRQSA
jgi:hypothetical protein